MFLSVLPTLKIILFYMNSIYANLIKSNYHLLMSHQMLSPRDKET